MEENDWQEKIDRLVIGGARVTDKGRLDFPSRLPFCPNQNCMVECIFWKFWIYLKGSGRIWEENNLAIGKCKPTKMNNLVFPDLYSQLDNYSEDYYKERILPVILMFYEKSCLEELFKIVSREK